MAPPLNLTVQAVHYFFASLRKTQDSPVLDSIISLTDELRRSSLPTEEPLKDAFDYIYLLPRVATNLELQLFFITFKSCHAIDYPPEVDVQFACTQLDHCSEYLNHFHELHASVFNVLSYLRRIEIILYCHRHAVYSNVVALSALSEQVARVNIPLFEIAFKAVLASLKRNIRCVMPNSILQL